MNVTEAVQECLKALVLPELKALATEIAAGRCEQARQAGQLDSTNHRLNDMHDTLIVLTQRQDGLSQRLDEQRKEIDARFQGIDARFQGIDARFQSIDARFDEQRRDFDARFQSIDAKFDEQRRDFDARFERLHGRMDTLIQVMVKPEDLRALHERVRRVEGHVRQLRRASGQ